jgi:dephospho-CoA kinase
MRYIGLTGNIASGKSEVARLLAERGATIIDADVLARDAVAPGTPALAQIVARWGPGVLASDGTLDRGALRQIVFADRGELDALNAIVHPAVAALRAERIAQLRGKAAEMVVYDVPLLFEANLAQGFDAIVLVDAPEALRLERLVQTRGLAPDEAQRMIAAQMPAREKRGRADFVVENDGTLAELAERVGVLWEQLTAQGPHSSLAG